MSAVIKLILELGPLVTFFACYYMLGVYKATGIFMAATVVAGIISYSLSRRISPLMIFSGVVVLIFGGLTIWLEDQNFIQLKPSIYYAAVAVILSFGLLTDRLIIKDVMDLAIHLTDQGWEKLTWRVSVFYVIMAALNVYVATAYTFDTWLWMKVWGFIPLNFLFFMAQVPLFLRYEVKEQENPPTTPA